MEMDHTVVVHYKDGGLKKGYTRNFAFFRDTFHLAEVDSESGEKLAPVEIPLEELKAVFFVKDFDGNSEYHNDPKAQRPGFGDRLEITFFDNETMIGYTRRFQDENNGFILYPADPRTNNEIVAVIRSAVHAIKAEKKHSYFSI